MFVLVIFSDLMPDYSNLVSTGYDLFIQKKKVEESENNRQVIHELEIKNKNLRLEINQVVSNYEENKNLSSVLSFLDKAAKESKIKFTSIRPKKLEKKDNLWMQPVEVNISSSYENIYNFTRYLESSSKVAVLKELSFKPEKILKPKLEMKAEIEFYLNL
jgi:Tfp pilus assembly protein PilO